MNWNLWTILGASVVAGCGTGCTTRMYVAFDPTQLTAAAPDAPAPLAGRALVVMDAADAGWVYRASPTTRFDKYIVTEFAVGDITRQAALHVLGRAFQDGAEYRETVHGAEGFTVWVTPKVDKFVYHWMSVQWLPAAVRPKLEMEMQVIFRAPDGQTILDETYRSGSVAGGKAKAYDEIHYMSDHRGAELDRLFQATIVDLLERAVSDYRQRMPR